MQGIYREFLLELAPSTGLIAIKPLQSLSYLPISLRIGTGNNSWGTGSRAAPNREIKPHISKRPRKTRFRWIWQF
jgi:hypothetical protein